MENSSSTKTELDQYGVWVKTPPRTLDEETPENEAEPRQPDFSFLDSPTPDSPHEASGNTDGAPHDEEEISVDEFVADEGGSPEQGEEARPSAGADGLPDGEIPLDEFLSDTPDENGTSEVALSDFLDGTDLTPNPSDRNLEPDGEVSLDDFLDSSDLVSADGGMSTQLSVEEPLDIDLTFDDTLPPPVVENTEGTVSNSSASVATASDDGTESVDLDAFLSDNDAPAPEQPATGDALLDNFDALFDSLQDNAPAAGEGAAPAGGEETVDLADFGITEDSGSVRPAAQQNYNLAVSAEDDNQEASPETVAQNSDNDDISLKLDESGEKAASGEAPFSAPDDGFDVDSLLNSIEDENGNAVALSSAPSAGQPSPSGQENVDLSEFLGEEGFSDPSVAEGNRSYAPGEHPEQNTDTVTSGDSRKEIVAENQKEGDNRGTESSSISTDGSNTESSADVTTEYILSEPEVVEPGPEPAAASAVADGGSDIPDDDLTKAGEETMENTTPNAHSQSSDTENLLKKIAEELVSLRTEIKEIRTDVDELMHKSHSAPAEAAPAASEAEATNDENGFFSDEDDDDTIALSGDELSNILNTAEFTAQDAETVAEEPSVETEEAGAAPAEEEVPVQEEPAAPVAEEPEVLPEPDTAEAEAPAAVPEEPAPPPAEDFGLEEPDLDDAEPAAASLPEEISVPKAEEAAEEPATEEPEPAPAVAEEPAAEEPEAAPSVAEEPAAEEPEAAPAIAEEAPPAEEPAAEGIPAAPAPEAEEPVAKEAGPDAHDELSVENIIATVKEDERFKEDFIPVYHEESKDDDFTAPTVAELGDSGEYSPLDEPLAPEDEFALQEPPAAETDEGQVEEAAAEPAAPQAPAAEEEEEELEAGISEEPVEGVFGQWNSAPQAEPEAPEPAATEPEPAAAAPAPEKTEYTAPEASAAQSAAEEPEEEPAQSDGAAAIPADMKAEIKAVLSYMDQLLESLPEEKIAEFAQSEQFSTYKKLFTELGLS